VQLSIENKFKFKFLIFVLDRLFFFKLYQSLIPIKINKHNKYSMCSKSKAAVGQTKEMQKNEWDWSGLEISGNRALTSESHFAAIWIGKLFAFLFSRSLSLTQIIQFGSGILSVFCIISKKYRAKFSKKISLMFFRS
jgi:hypothetical protein